MRTFNKLILLVIMAFLGLEILWWLPRVLGLIEPHNTPLLDYLLITSQGAVITQLMVIVLLLLLLYCVYYLYTGVANYNNFVIKKHTKTDVGDIVMSYGAIADYVNHYALENPEFKKSRTTVFEVNGKLKVIILVNVIETDNIPAIIQKRTNSLKEHLLTHFGQDFIHSIEMSVAKIIPQKKKSP